MPGEARNLSGKVALITGAARGMGEAEARLLAEQGARVVLTDVLDTEGAAVAADLKDAARFVHHDVSVAAEWDHAVEVALGEFGRLDILVNNAAIYWTNRIADETPEGFERLFRVNLLGSFLGIKAAIAPLRAAGGGSIVNISSLAGLEGLPGHGAYGAAKWGVRGLTKTAALELGEFGIRVNSIHPGAIDTPMINHTEVRRGPGQRPSVPLRRVGLPEDVAELVAFLASDASSYITGSEFPIDGGSFAGPTPPVTT